MNQNTSRIWHEKSKLQKQENFEKLFLSENSKSKQQKYNFGIKKVGFFLMILSNYSRISGLIFELTIISKDPKLIVILKRVLILMCKQVFVLI